MQERFTERVRKVIALARQEAIRLHHDYIGTEHLLLGLVKEGEGVAAVVLTNLGVNLEDLRRSVENAVSSGSETLVLGEVPLNQEARSALNHAVDEARKMNHTYIGTEHLLLGLLREERGVACQVLQSLGMEIELVRLLGNWVVRCLAPHCCRVELSALPDKRDETRLLHAMGFETANVHLGSKQAIKAVRLDAAKRPPDWLHNAAMAMAEAVARDWDDWRQK